MCFIILHKKSLILFQIYASIIQQNQQAQLSHKTHATTGTAPSASLHWEYDDLYPPCRVATGCPRGFAWRLRILNFETGFAQTLTHLKVRPTLHTLKLTHFSWYTQHYYSQQNLNPALLSRPAPWVSHVKNLLTSGWHWRRAALISLTSHLWNIWNVLQYSTCFANSLRRYVAFSRSI